MKPAGFHLIPLRWKVYHFINVCGLCSWPACWFIPQRFGRSILSVANKKAHMCTCTGKDFSYRKCPHVCHPICLYLGADCPLHHRVESQRPRQAMTTQSLKVEPASCLEQYQKVNLGSGSKATNLHQTGQSWLCNIKKTRVKRESPRLIKVHTRKTLQNANNILHFMPHFWIVCLSKSLKSQFSKRGLNATQRSGVTAWRYPLNSARSPSKRPRHRQLPQHTQTITPKSTASLSSAISKTWSPHVKPFWNLWTQQK